MLGRNIRPVGVVAAHVLARVFSRCLCCVFENLGGVCICSRTGIATFATLCGAIFKENCYVSLRGIIFHVRVVITINITSFSLMGLVRPKAVGRAGRVQRASTPSRGGGAASCVCRGCFESSPEFGCKYLFKTMRDALFSNTL